MSLGRLICWISKPACAAATTTAYAIKKTEQERQKGYTENIKIIVLDPKTKTPKKRFRHGELALIHLSWERSGVKHAGVTIMKQSGEYIFGTNTYGENKILRGGSKDIYYALRLSVGPGEYFLKAGLSGKTDKEVLGFVEEGPSIIVEMPKDETQWGGVAFLPHAWGDKDVKL